MDNHRQQPPRYSLKCAAVLLSVAASVRRHGVNPWAYVRHALTESAARQPDADLADLLPDVWAKSCGETRLRAG
jgi:hypothetical protein